MSKGYIPPKQFRFLIQMSLKYGEDHLLKRLKSGKVKREEADRLKLDYLERLKDKA